MYRNRFQLGTRDVLYSDGDKYVPAIIVTEHFKRALPSVRNVLVLGTGLGSLAQIITRKGFRPVFTTVEKDKVVLKWAMELAGDEITSLLQPVCMDAATFMKENTSRYDLVFIDIFNSRTVPSFVTEEPFLLLCKRALAPNGHLAFNYIVNDKKEWEEVQRVFSVVFPGYEVISRSINKIIVA